MLNLIRIFAILMSSSSMTAESVPIQIPAKPTLIPRQGITPRQTFTKPTGSLSKSILANGSSSLLRPSSSYTLDLEPEVVKGVCVSTVTETETEWLVFRKQSNVLRYTDGRRERSVIFHVTGTTVGSQLLQPFQTEANLKRCLSPQTASDEEALRSQVNACLKGMGNSVEVSYLTTSIGELQCPMQPEQKRGPTK